MSQPSLRLVVRYLKVPSTHHGVEQLPDGSPHINLIVIAAGGEISISDHSPNFAGFWKQSLRWQPTKLRPGHCPDGTRQRSASLTSLQTLIFIFIKPERNSKTWNWRLSSWREFRPMAEKDDQVDHIAFAQQCETMASGASGTDKTIWLSLAAAWRRRAAEYRRDDRN